VVAAVAERGRRAVVRGSGTKLDWTAPPDRADVVLDTSKLTGILAH